MSEHSTHTPHSISVPFGNEGSLRAQAVLTTDIVADEMLHAGPGVQASRANRLGHTLQGHTPPRGECSSLPSHKATANGCSAGHPY